MSVPRTASISWMKSLGMALIVYGHVGAFLPGAILPPINTKQLGVALFVFVTGMTLARDTRPRQQIVVRRLFELVVFTALLAVVVSAVGTWWDGDPRESNYLPLLFGANVLIDAFPANPTTWFAGTYMHLIVVAVLLHGRWQPGWWSMALVASAEVGIRAALLAHGLTFVPYMLLTNWVTIYFLGTLWGRGDRAVRRPAVALVTLALAAAVLGALPPLVPAFPFFVPASPNAAAFVLVSASVTLLYTGTTVAAAQAFSAIGERIPAVVDWVAAHSLMIFLAHMPVIFALLPVTTAFAGAWRVPLLFAAAIAIPGAVSVLLHQAMDLATLRDRAVNLLPAH